MSKDKIILDHGSFNIRYGYAGYDKPDGQIRSLVAIKSNKKNKQNLPKVFVNVNENKGYQKNMKLYYPIQNGVIVDFDLMTFIWDEIFYNKLKIKPKNCSILITEPIGTSKITRENITKIMFEKYKFKRIQFCCQEIASVYGTGRGTGLIVDIGHNITKCVPVYDSYIITSGVTRTNLAGKRLNNFLKRKMHLSHNLNDYELHLEKKKHFISSNNNSSYRSLFIDPSLDHLDSMSIPQQINEAIKRSDIDLRKDLSKNIILVGGSSMIPGLCKDINEKLNEIGKIKGLKYRLHASRNRSYSSWLGASILTCMPTFKNHWIKNKTLISGKKHKKHKKT